MIVIFSGSPFHHPHPPLLSSVHPSFILVAWELPPQLTFKHNFEGLVCSNSTIVNSIIRDSLGNLLKVVAVNLGEHKYSKPKLPLCITVLNYPSKITYITSILKMISFQTSMQLKISGQLYGRQLTLSKTFNSSYELEILRLSNTSLERQIKLQHGYLIQAI